MPRNKPTTSYAGRTEPTTSYSSRMDGNFLMTQTLDFLMTEDDNYIVIQDSYSDFIKWVTRDIITTNYT